MAVLEMSKEQIFELVRQMPTDQKREMLRMLAASGAADRTKRQEFAEGQLRRLFLARGIDWDASTPEDREKLIDDLIHEDRPCAR